MLRLQRLLPIATLLATAVVPGAALAQLITVKAPAYRADVNGETPIHLAAAGYRGPLVVKSWLPGAASGTDSTVATVPLDEKGEGSFTFPAEHFAHGPLAVRITGTRIADGYVDTSYLQLYNTGGVHWNEGIPAEAPPAASGMSLVFKDDFDGPLSISANGVDARYAAHKPGGGDFSQIPFVDPTASGPFFQRDTYLIIEANALQKTTGLLASVNTFDGRGFSVSAPYYMECRFLAPDAPGTWPAWWTLTNGVTGGKWSPVADELDIIEAYGGDGAKNPNAPATYEVTPHTWGYKDESLKYKTNVIHMDKSSAGAAWASAPHTYGVLVTATTMTFYLDNVEVVTMPASPIVEKEPTYFLLNLAVGGNGWPVDLSRYDNRVDMYVDYIRVYH